MTEAKTAAQRKAAERQRHREAGRTAVTVHVRPEWAAEVRELEAKLQRREGRKRAPCPHDHAVEDWRLHNSDPAP